MKLKIMIIGWVAFFSLNSITAQNDRCGTILNQAQINYMDETRSARETVNLNNFGGQTITIPLVAHIVRTTSGTGGLTNGQLTYSLNQLNNAFQQLDFEFELCTVNYIDEDTLYNNRIELGDLETYMTTGNTIANKVNVFFVNKSKYCGWAYFPGSYQFGKDWIIMKNSCATNGSTLAHEIGHYFNLYHTHQGVSSSIGITAEELVDRSNCGPNVGDELCDTPADPNISGKVDNSCQYTENAVDANGDSYIPDTQNLMSYSLKSCRTDFSLEQRARMLQSYMVDRSYLDNCSVTCPNTLALTGTESGFQDYQAADSISSTQQLTNTANVTYQAGELIILQPGFISYLGSEFLATSANCLNVKNSNFYSFTAETQEESKFSDLHPDLQEKKNTARLSATPNPFQTGTTLSFDLKQDTETNLMIFDINGKKIKQLAAGQLAKGSHNFVWQPNQLSPGVYFARLIYGNEVQTVKIILAQ